MAKDAADTELALGDLVLYARSPKDAGISWSHHVITRLTEKSFWYTSTHDWPDPSDGNHMIPKTYEHGPLVCRNCVRLNGQADRPTQDA